MTRGRLSAALSAAFCRKSRLIVVSSTPSSSAALRCVCHSTALGVRRSCRPPTVTPPAAQPSTRTARCARPARYWSNLSLERARFVVMKRPPLGGHSALGRGRTNSHKSTAGLRPLGHSQIRRRAPPPRRQRSAVDQHRGAALRGVWKMRNMLVRLRKLEEAIAPPRRFVCVFDVRGDLVRIPSAHSQLTPGCLYGASPHTLADYALASAFLTLMASHLRPRGVGIPRG